VTVNSELRPIPSLSVVVPAYNEIDNVGNVCSRVAHVLSTTGVDDWELIFSVDPSSDGTEDAIRQLAQEEPRIKLIRFSRKVGQPAATIAGMAASTKDACVVIDCDLQDPPELIADLVHGYREGYDVVYAQRRTREGETVIKRAVASLGYSVIGKISEVDIPKNTGDFRLMSHRVVAEVVALGESHGFLKGLVPYVGFPTTGVQYDRAAREAGASKYNRFWGSLLIGLNGVIGFSRYPLQLISISGLILALLAIVVAITYAALKIAGVDFPAGNVTIVVVVSFFSGVQLLSIGIMGEYVGRIYDEVKRRPKWIVESQTGLSREAVEQLDELRWR
jgi:glycosyltransferase involved in cell wall biosynthesis